MEIKRHCQFLLDKKANEKYARLRYRVKWNKNTDIVSFSVGYLIDADKWSINTQRCITNTTHGEKKISAALINRVLSNFEEVANTLFIHYEKLAVTPSKLQFKHDFNVKLGRVNEIVQSVDFFDIYDLFIKTVSMQNQWTIETNIKFNSLKLHLTEFDSSIQFDKINDDYLYRFIQYFQSAQAGKVSNDKATQGLRNTTIGKNMGFLRWFLRWAFNNGYYKGNSHLTFKPKLKGVDWQSKEIIFLEWEELLRLYNYQFRTDERSLEQVRDVFCFCCFTSLRYSDVAKLKRSDVRKDSIEIVTKKTNDRLSIDLNNYSRTILQKYNDFVFDNNLALPIISNQKMNDHLKTIGELAEINTPITEVYFIGNQRYEEINPKWALLTTHAGRRTFIVNALYLGIPAEVVMSFTGHSDFKAMKPYVKITNNLKAKSMGKFNLVHTPEKSD